MSIEVIKTEGLTKQYGKLAAVDGADLVVPPGCVFALMGRNGAGKTTLIRCLLGLTPISGGSARVLGKDAAREHVAIRREVGYVPETHHLIRWMRIEELAWFTSAFYPTWNATLCGDLLRRFDLDPKKRVRELSRGMVAKLALTLALAHEPSLLVLDEPTSGLDAVVRKEFLESVIGVAAVGGRTVLISSHILHDVERVTDRVALMDHGRIRLVEDLATLKQRMREVRVTFKGEPPAGCDLPGLLRLQRGAHEWVMVFGEFDREMPSKLATTFPGARIETREMNLEEIFVALVEEETPEFAASGAGGGERR